MAQYIDKDALVAEIERILLIHTKRYDELTKHEVWITAKEIEHRIQGLKEALSIINSLEVKDPYEQCIQYASIEAGIKAHAEDYSFNIESELFNQLTKEQQALWRKEIEQAVISGGYNGLNLARDPRYKENLEVKEVSEVNLEKELDEWMRYGPHTNYPWCTIPDAIKITAEHFFELGLKAQKGE